MHTKTETLSSLADLSNTVNLSDFLLLILKLITFTLSTTCCCVLILNKIIQN